MTYIPQAGTIPFRALAHLNALAAGTKIANGALADALEVDAATLATTLQTARRHGAIKAEKIEGRTYWSRGDGTPEAKPHDFEPDEPLVTRSASAAAAAPAAAPAPVQASHDAAAAEAQVLAKEPAGAALFGAFSDGSLTINQPGGQNIALGPIAARELYAFMTRVWATESTSSMPCDRGHARVLSPDHRPPTAAHTMNFKNPLSKPDPRKRKEEKLHEARLDLINYAEAAEYYVALAAMARNRVARYENELAADQQREESKTGLRVAA